MRSTIRCLAITGCILFATQLCASSDDDIESLVGELRYLASSFKDGGQCLRRKGIKLCDLGKKWCEDSQEKLRDSIRQYNEEILMEFDQKANLSQDNLLKSKERMVKLRDAALSRAAGRCGKSAEQMDYVNEHIQLWNKFVAKWKKLSEVVKGAKSDYSFSKEVLACGSQMMNDGMCLYFRGCDFEREASIFDEFGFELTEQQFNDLCAERRKIERGE